MSAEKYRVGDKVIVKSLAWYNENKNECGDVKVPCCFVREMSKYCGKVVTISRVNYSSYSIDDDGGRFSWSDQMFEVLAEDTHVFIKTKDVKDLPKDFAECAKVVGFNEDVVVKTFGEDKVARLQKVTVCRDVYWELAGGWKPDWKKNTKKHCVVIRDGRVGVATTISKQRRFAFPTPEMADAFGKNFKKELEACKEVLENK